MIHLVEKSSKLVSASVKSFSFIGEKKMKKKYFTLNKWRLARRSPRTTLLREKNIKLFFGMCTYDSIIIYTYMYMY